MIAIVDYGLGNIKAFVNVYKRLNLPCVVASDPASLKRATKIILPGVGAFDYAMKLLNNSGLREELEHLVLVENVPVLGVCVGMQILGKSSEEGVANGLGWVDGVVKKINFAQSANPLPHMGWNSVSQRSSNGIFKEIDDASRFYFLHSYFFQCTDVTNEIASANYGNDFTCAINRQNIFGVQFHPEKSHNFGIQLLNNFATL